MDPKVKNSGYGTTSSHPGGSPSDSTGRGHETVTLGSNKQHANNGRTEQSVPSRQFAGHPCSTRPPESPRVSGCAVTRTEIRQTGSQHSPKPFYSAYSVGQKTVVTRLSSPYSRSTATESSADSWMAIARGCCDIFKSEIIENIRFMKDVTEQQVYHALSKLRYSETVMPLLEGLSSDTKLNAAHIWALKEVVRAHQLLKLDQKPYSGTGLRGKEPESTIKRNRQKSSPKYHIGAQTPAKSQGAYGSGQPRVTPSHQPPKTKQPVKIKSPVHTRTEQSSGTQREIQGIRAGLLKPQTTQREETHSAKNERDRPLTTNADPSYGSWLGLKGEDLTPSLRFDIEQGIAGANEANHSRKPEELLPKISSQRTAVKNVRPPVIQVDLPKTNASTPQTANASGSSTSRLRPPTERKQETPLIPRNSHFLPIRPEANVAATTAMTEGLNLPKAPEPGGARRKHLPPGVGSGSARPAPVIPARPDAALTKASDRPAQRVTQNSPQADSENLGHATKAQLDAISNNLYLYAHLRGEYLKKIVNSINSLGLNKETIETACGKSWIKQTQDTLDYVQEEYVRQKESLLSPSPAVEVGQVTVTAEGLSNANRPENSISKSNDSEQVTEAAGSHQSIDPAPQRPMRTNGLQAIQSTTRPSEEGSVFVSVEDILDAMVDEASPVSSHQSSERSSPWEIVADEHGFEFVVDTGSQAPYTDHQQIQVLKPWDALGLDNPTPSLRYDIQQQAIDPSALADQSGHVRITDEQKQPIISKLETLYPMDAVTRQMIRRNIGTIQLTAWQVEAAINGGRESLGDILEKCQLRDSELSFKATFGRQYDGFVQNQRHFVPVSRNGSSHSASLEDVTNGFVARSGQSSVLPDVRAAAVHAGEGIINPRVKAALNIGAGIQARNNNCGLASFFMSISNNGLLGTLISDAENKIETLDRLGDFVKARSLNELVNLLKKFNIGDNVRNYIPNDELDKIRLHCGLREVKLSPHVVDDAFNKPGQTVKFMVESEFDDGHALNRKNKKAAISLQISAGPVQDSLHATVNSLPDPSLGFMRLRGIPLTLNQKLTQADLAELKFVPFGELLESAEILDPILKEIYDYLNTEAGPLQSASELRNKPTSLKHKVALVEMQNDRRTLPDKGRSSESENFKSMIEDEKIPNDLKIDHKKTIKKSHRYNSDVTGETIEHYFNKQGVLILKLTKEHHHLDEHVIRKEYEFYDEYGNQSRKTTVEMEKYFQNGTPFIRSKTSEFVNKDGERMRVEKTMTGYIKSSPTKGTVTTTVMKRADDFEEMINIFIDSCVDRNRDVQSAKKELLPDRYNNSPEVIFMTIPNEGKDNRVKFDDWQKDVGLPMYGSKKKIPYEVSAVMAIQESHYVSWRKDRMNGLIHYADSMGEVENEVPIPVVVTMPDQDTEAALQSADLGANGKHRHYKEAKDKLKVLGTQVALVMLKRKTIN